MIKTTLFVRKQRAPGSFNTEEKQIATEKGFEFASPELHIGKGPEMYKVMKVEQVNDCKMKVFYDYKYRDEEKAFMKLALGKELTESEIEALIEEAEFVCEKEREKGRWQKHLTTAIEVDGEKYAIDWSKGLTESQENSYDEQPYKIQ